MLNSAQLMRQALNSGRIDSIRDQVYTPQQTNLAAVQSGQALGYHLEVVENPLAELTDSLEELSFQFEEKEMKSIGERKLGEKHGPRSAYFAAVQGWQKIMPDMPGGQYMESVLRQLRQMERNSRPANFGQLIKMLEKGSEDPSHQFAMLDIIEQALEPQEKGLRNLIAEARARLTEMKGPEIRAGINLADQVNAQATSTEEMQNLRDLYRNEVLGFTTPQTCFRSLLESRGAGKLAEALEFLEKGCSIDLQSPSPSQSPEQLRRVLVDLQCVNVLKAVLEQSDKLVGKMKSQFGETCLLNGEKMTGCVMDFTEMPFVNAENIASFVKSCGVTALLAQLYFCTELLNVFRSLSPRLFEEEEGRFRLIDAGQEHLDGLVMQQEDEDERKRKGERGAA